jgi:N-acetylglutamate synthase-like GNAT family acetyltransferase
VEAFVPSARRATVEDLPALQALWIEAGLPWEELEQFLGEFQVVPDETGALVAAIGLLVEGADGLLHTEAVAGRATDQADEWRSVLWRRIQIVARNQGIHRLWTQEDAPFWLTVFAPAAAETVGASAAAFLGSDPPAGWRLHELVNPAKARQLVDEQMAIWSAHQAQERVEFQRKTRTFMALALLLVAVVIAVCAWLVFRVLNAQPDLLQRLFSGGK